MLLKRSRRLFATLRGPRRPKPAAGRTWSERLGRAVRLTDWGHGFAALALTTVAAAVSVLAWAGGAHGGRDVDLIAGKPTDVGLSDWFFIAAAGITLVLGSLLAFRAVFDRTARRLAAFGLAAAVVAIASELLGLLAASRPWPTVGQAAGVITICSAVPAALTAATGLLLVGIRLHGTARLAVERRSRDRRSRPDESGQPPNPTLFEQGRPATGSAPAPAPAAPRRRPRRRRRPATGPAGPTATGWTTTNDRHPIAGPAPRRRSASACPAAASARPA